MRSPFHPVLTRDARLRKTAPPSLTFVLSRVPLALLLIFAQGGCPLTNPAGGTAPATISADTTLDALTINAGDTSTIENNAVVTVNGDATISGTLAATDGRLTLRVSGALKINGALKAMHSAAPELPPDTPFNQQPVGIHILVGKGEVTFGATAVIQTNGNFVVTDDETVLGRTPRELSNEVQDVSGDSLPTLVPLPPENAAFRAKPPSKVRQTAQGLLPPVTVAGTWPPAGAPPPPGDVPVVIYRFGGPRDLNINNWTFNGPAAPAGASADKSGGADAGQDATGKNSKNGLNLNIRNDGGKINIQGAVVLNLADGGPGGDATAVCASATGGNGGEPGNFRMTAAGGIDLTGGTLVINPGAGGKGGDATVTKGAPGAAGCPGAAGGNSTATAGKGGRNQKALYVRGDVAGLANVTIGALTGGRGGDAKATACDGGPGNPCCNGGKGGDATATGGKGGDASLNVRGLPVATGAVTGGDGGDATATGGNGGNGGDCKFGNGGDGGAGGNATATAGAGGSATNSAGAATGGNGGAATATGGNGGNGGNSGFGAPGAGGPGGGATGKPGTGGTGNPAGTNGQKNENPGTDGQPGGQMPVTLYCLHFVFVQSSNNIITPGVQTGPVLGSDETTNVGTLPIEFRDLPGAVYRRGTNPDHIGIQNGQVDLHASQLMLKSGTPGLIGGIRIEPLSANGINGTSPLVVQALDASGQVVGTQTFATLPDNTLHPENPQSVDARFPVTQSVTTFRIIVPAPAFVTIVEIYLIDP